MAAKRRPYKLTRASAYYRVAAKFDRHGQPQQATHYRKIADRLVRENQADTERLRARAAADEAWKSKRPTPKGTS